MRALTRRTAVGVSAAAVGVALLPIAGAQAESGVPSTEPAAPAVVAPPVVPGPTRAELRHARAEVLRKKLIQLAKYKGRTWQYVAGGAGPNSGDCSGFVMYLVKKTTHRNLPHFSGAQMHATKRVAKRNLLPGDLLFWGSNGGQHVSIYIGHGKMIGANNPSRDVVIEPIHSSYWSPRYAGAGRIIFG